MFVVMLELQWNLYNPDTLGTRLKRPGYRCVLISLSVQYIGLRNSV